MENYYKQRAELEVAHERLNSKIEEKEQIYVKYFGGRKDVIETNKNIPANQDKMMKYLVELEEKGIFEEINNLRKEIRIKDYRLRKMEKILSNLGNIEYKFLKLRYFEEHEYSLEEIAIKLAYSIDRIKQISAKIEREMKKFKK